MKLVNQSLHQRVKEKIYEIISNDFKQMDKIPSEQKLSESLGVSRSTVREAIKGLEQGGILFSRHGVGTFILNTKKTLKTRISILESSTNIILDQGYAPGTINVNIDIRKVPSFINNKLSLKDNDDVFYIERVRTADEKPVIYIEDYLPYIPNMMNEYNEKEYESLLDFMKVFDLEVAFSSCSIKAVISDEKTENKLGLEKEQALLLLKQIHYSKTGLPVLYSDSYYISDVFEFNVIRRRIQ